MFNMLPSYIKIESDYPKKLKLILQEFLYENSFYSLDEYFELIYLCSKLVFESLANKRDIHLCSFLLLLICILDLVVYIM